MKNISLLSFILLMTLSCNKNDNVVNSETSNEDTLFSIDISNYIYTTDPHYIRTGHVYLTDFEGKLLRDTVLMNDNEYILRSDYDYLNGQYDVTFETKWEDKSGEVTTYVLNTFIDIDPMIISLGKSNKNPNNEEANIIISNMGNLVNGLDSISNSSYNISCYNSDGGYCDLGIKLKQIPDNIYTSFKKNGENFKRYLWIENVNGQTKDTFELDDIPVLTEAKVITYPSDNDYVSTEIFGYLTEESSRFYRLTKHGLDNGVEQIKHFYPQDMFDGYKVETLLRSSNVNYFTSRISQDVLETFLLPNIDYQITNSNVENFEIQSSDNFDYYSIYFFYYKEGLRVQWKVYGKYQEIINFSLVELAQTIFINEPSFSISELGHFYSRLYNIVGISSYEDILQSIMEANSEARTQIEYTEYIEKK